MDYGAEADSSFGEILTKSETRSASPRAATALAQARRRTSDFPSAAESG
jgi:hypothetical protein